MKKTLILLYAAIGYLIGMASVAYMAGFIANIGVPKAIGDGAAGSPWTAALTDAGLLWLFGLHHSITARASFKRWWTKFVPAAIERATYVYMTAGLIALLVLLWQPIPTTIWDVQWLPGQIAIWALYLGCWGMMVAATFHFGHFRFLGIAQAWERFRNAPPPGGRFSARYLYAIVRHPISLGWIAAPLLVPHLTAGHLLFSLAALVYVLIATPFEEADLIEELGDTYRDYRRRVPAFLPRF